eukprot:TRINITY_DN21660_c0_g1_i1.p1 TRINITY_DN21660_c0_g1~~TRINITY_DN21660_c0_g1_i1.p1  ORF type:complete len:1156 (-),score=184.33 TRINITY_DN21660_c0_g1_i1:456-3923(-)
MFSSTEALKTTEELSMRNSLDANQLECNLENAISPGCQNESFAGDSFPELRRCVQRIVDHNRKWVMELLVQKLIIEVLLGDRPAPVQKLPQSRKEILVSVKHSCDFWQTLATASRQTTKVAPPGSSASLTPRTHEPPLPAVAQQAQQAPRDFPTLMRHSPARWSAEVRHAGGILPSRPASKDLRGLGIPGQQGFSNYLELLIAEQERWSAMPREDVWTPYSSRTSSRQPTRTNAPLSVSLEVPAAPLSARTLVSAGAQQMRAPWRPTASSPAPPTLSFGSGASGIRAHANDPSKRRQGPLFHERLPPVACLLGAPMRRPGQAQILSDFGEDRILAEFGDETAAAESKETEERPEVRYFRSCDELSLVPSKFDFLASETIENVDLSDTGLTDKQLQAIMAGLSQRASALWHLDLSRNRLLTNDGIEAALASLVDTAGALRVLRLAGIQVGLGAIRVLSRAMHARFRLEELSLRNVPLVEAAWHDLCQGLEGTSLVHLDLCDTQCGRWQQQTCVNAVSSILGLRSLTSIDLSNNYFRREGLAALGDALTSSASSPLESLRLDDNACGEAESFGAGTGDASAGEQRAHPVVAFCERLTQNTTLRRLSLQRSQVDALAACCLADVVLGHPCLQQLHLAGNPLGEQGLRAVLMGLLWPGSRLEELDLAEFRDARQQGFAVAFNYADLWEDYSGNQALYLSRPYHRSVLRLLLRRAEAFAGGFQRIRLNGKSVEAIPCERSAGKKSWVADPCAYLEACFARKRLRVTSEKFAYLIRAWRLLRTEFEQTIFVRAVSKDCVVKLGQLKFLLDEVAKSSPSSLPNVLVGLSLATPRLDRACCNSALRFRPRRARLDAARLALRPQTPMPVRAALGRVEKLLQFNPGNPSGQYDLDLADPCDYAVAERALLISNWESEQAAALQLPDTSQRGDYHALRNATLAGAPVSLRSLAKLPGDGYVASGGLSFSYVSPLGPSSSSSARVTPPPLPDDVFARLLTCLRGCGDVAACSAERSDIASPAGVAQLPPPSELAILGVAGCFAPPAPVGAAAGAGDTGLRECCTPRGCILFAVPALRAFRGSAGRHLPRCTRMLSWLGCLHMGEPYGSDAPDRPGAHHRLEDHSPLPASRAAGAAGRRGGKCFRALQPPQAASRLELRAEDGVVLS